MEEHLIEILKRNTAYADLSEAERAQMAEWCSDDEEFQSLKVLFQQVDVWSDSNKEETNTKLRLDQLYAIQYAGKQSTQGKTDVQFRKNGFRNMATWLSVTAVAAALVVTWMMFQPKENTLTAKNEKKEKGTTEAKKEVKDNPDQKMAPENTPVAHAKQVKKEEFEWRQNESASLDSVAQTIPITNIVAGQMDAVTMNTSSSLAFGSSVTLSAVGATSYTWTNDNANSASTISIDGNFFSANVSNKKELNKKKLDATRFTSFSVKAMPEMLDELVAAY